MLSARSRLKSREIVLSALSTMDRAPVCDSAVKSMVQLVLFEIDSAPPMLARPERFIRASAFDFIVALVPIVVIFLTSTAALGVAEAESDDWDSKVVSFLARG